MATPTRRELTADTEIQEGVTLGPVTRIVAPAGSTPGTVPTVDADGTSLVLAGPLASQSDLDAVESAAIDADAALDARVDALEANEIPVPTVGAILRGEDDGAGGAVWVEYPAGVEGQVLVMLDGLPTWGTLSGGGQTAAISVVLDGGGSVLAAGVAGDVRVPFACTITGVSLLADQTGDIVVDIWKDTFANAPPTVADTITASAKPTLSSAAASEDTTLTGWTVAIAAGDVLRFNIDSAATITRATLTLTVTRS